MEFVSYERNYVTIYIRTLNKKQQLVKNTEGLSKEKVRTLSLKTSRKSRTFFGLLSVQLRTSKGLLEV